MARPPGHCARTLELQGGESPVQHLPVGLADGVDQRSQRQHPAAPVGQRARRLDVQLAVERVALVHGPGVVAGLPAEHRRPDWAAAGWPAPTPARWCARRTPVAAADPRIMVCGSDVQAQPRQFRCAAHDVGRCCAAPCPRARRRSAARGTRVRNASASQSAVGSGRRRSVDADGRQVVGVAGVGRAVDSTAASRTGRSRAPGGRPGRWSSSAARPDRWAPGPASPSSASAQPLRFGCTGCRR